MNQNRQIDNSGNDEVPKATSTTCKPVAAERPNIELPSQRINTQIQFMKDHALIGKLIGFWPTEKALQLWIAAKWKTKGHITLQLGPKGFFMVVFNYIEDQHMVIDGGPYFFNAADLWLRDWIKRFNPDKEDLSWALVWRRLYSLPLEYWDEDSLQDIGNALGESIKIAEETKLRRYTSYACICVYMHLNKALPDMVSLYHDDFEWIQSIDYEHVPFRCRKCHALCHLFCDCSLNVKPPTYTFLEKPSSKGFTKVNNRKKNHKKPASYPKIPPVNSSMPSTNNSFDILAQPASLDSESPTPSINPLKSPSKFNPTDSGHIQKPS